MPLFLVKRRFAVRSRQKAAMVIRARDQEEALCMAQDRAGPEGKEAWDRGRVDVTRLRPTGKSEVILDQTRCSGVMSTLLEEHPPLNRRGVIALLARMLTGSA